jgi:RNA polymerase sigma factor (sigma-70 family)
MVERSRVQFRSWGDAVARRGTGRERCTAMRSPDDSEPAGRATTVAGRGRTRIFACPSPSGPGLTDPTQPDLPRALSRLLDARTPARADAAWDDFVAIHSRLLLHVVRALTSDRDAAMDAYARVLERLREDDFRRLRAYVPDGRTRFTTWLVAVVRRLCLDWHRERYGRARTEGSTRAREAHERRRQRSEDVGQSSGLRKRQRLRRHHQNVHDWQNSAELRTQFKQLS